MKRTAALIPLTCLALALAGCSLGEQEATETTTDKPTVSIEGEFVFAPADGAEDSEDEDSAMQAPRTSDAPDVGDLFTMSVAGSKVTVTKRSCTTDSAGEPTPTTDARQTAFGELGEASSETAAPIQWLEPGAFTEGETSELTVLGEGDMAKIDDKSFFAASGTQGKALVDQFDEGCQPEETDEDEDTQTPEPGQSGQPSTGVTEPSDAGGQQ